MMEHAMTAKTGCRLTALLFLLVFSACTSFNMEKPRVFVEDIQPIGGGLLSQRFLIVLRLQNPNDRDLHVSGLDFNLDLNDTRFASGVSNQRVTIPRLGSETVLVEASTSTFDLLVQAFRLSDRPRLDYDLYGRVHIEDSFGGTVPFEDGGEITLNRPTS
jgi:LEA14-like dessication related protein